MLRNKLLYGAGYCDVEKNSDGILDGYTVIYDSTNKLTAKVEAKYYYVLGFCDYLRSEGFVAGSMAFDRSNSCRKQNRAKKIQDPWFQKRFYSIDRGFFSLFELLGEKEYSFGTKPERLRSLYNKLKRVDDYERPSIKKWCKSGICACSGAMNCSLKKYSSITENEHKDLLSFFRHEAQEHMLSRFAKTEIG
ncbi:hypothetical protein [Vibrio sp. D431a]|uniref:hypothetical protein n=1 Tax=Vibrio sp. D431a TaxID=2837388 RepID=UPI002554A898|nr:hypothetical protein [Vibrio sp. D431a]MDK9790139.1 hypothetical protein [Vibrio sp. D431a]